MSRASASLELTVDGRGAGRPYLVLHGGAGPQSVAAFAQLLAERTTTGYSPPPIQASAVRRVRMG